MEALKIIISGIIDGLTGFLPVSSSGHQILLRDVLNFGAGESILFDAMLRTASICVIVFGFRKDVIRLMRACRQLLFIGLYNISAFFHNLFMKEDMEYYPVTGAYKRLAVLILAATVSTGITGCFARSFAAYAAQTIVFPGCFLVATGVMLFLVDGVRKGEISINDAGIFEAFVIGGVQGLSVLPGLARCGMVIAACLLFGYDRKLTWRFAFLAAVPSLAGAVILDVTDMIRYGITDAGNTGWYILASLLSVVSGYIGLIWVNRILKKGRFRYISVYCLIIGAFMLASIVVL